MLSALLSALLGVLLGAALVSGSSGARSDEELWRALVRGGHVALMRHARAPGTGDPAGFRVEDCATQRNLDDEGRRDARAWGEALRRRGVPVTRVMSGRWCRSLETARLMDVGAVETQIEALDSFFTRPDDREKATRALKDLIASLDRDGTAVMVTHQVNITALTGVFPASGEAVILRLEPDGGFSVLGRLPPP